MLKQKEQIKKLITNSTIITTLSQNFIPSIEITHYIFYDVHIISFRCITNSIEFLKNLSVCKRKTTKLCGYLYIQQPEKKCFSFFFIIILPWQVRCIRRCVINSHRNNVKIQNDLFIYHYLILNKSTSMFIEKSVFFD